MLPAYLSLRARGTDLTGQKFMRRAILVLLLAVAGVVVTPQLASAHVERPSYWPDPAPDCSVSPCAGGVVPQARSLASALDRTQPGKTRVVCQSDSLDRVRQAISSALVNGYDIRPTDHRTLSASEADALLSVNKKLFNRCSYDEIQPAINDSGNNDRVVVMPGVYTEPTARSQPTHDPACAQYTTKSDSGDPGALTHEYQVRCPNDANLVAVIGRGIGHGTDPEPPLADRHGIPNAGDCIRCNLQLEGSGVSADDVVIEAGDAAAGNGGPSAVGHAKDVGLFVDRADGFVMRNMTVRHAREHDIYMLETDGYLLDRFKTYFAGGYGVLTFVEDHGLIQNCEAAGNGDSGLYPGSGAPTSLESNTAFYPDAPRYSQEIRWCDIHHNTGGFSGTDSHGTLIDHNNFYGNALGFTTDVFTAAGHPGFPQGGNTIANNNFYSNNFNPFQPDSDVEPFIAAPVGTGLWFAGGNDNVVRGNHFYDNWRRGLMLFAVPDATVCGPVIGTPMTNCDPTHISTSFRNQFHDNVMGVAPDGTVKPNGTDFWWDSFPGNMGNCWYRNTAAPGKSVTTSPANLPACNDGQNPETSIGTGDVGNEAELAACLAGFEVSGYPAGNSTLCSWPITPEQPGTSSGLLALMTKTADPTAQLQSFTDLCASAPGSRTCAPFLSQLGITGWVASALQTVLPSTVVADPPGTLPLSTYTCSWWRQADASARAGLVDRLQSWVGGAVEGDSKVGYGATLTRDQASRVFDDRCSTAYAGPLALYKIYGPAAAFIHGTE
jgi:hypothetical protein